LPSQFAHTPVGSVGRSRLQRGLEDLLLQLRSEDPSRPLAFPRLADSLAAAAREGGAGGQNRGAPRLPFACAQIPNARANPELEMFRMDANERNLTYGMVGEPLCDYLA
jgi:hypothetical protein